MKRKTNKKSVKEMNLKKRSRDKEKNQFNFKKKSMRYYLANYFNFFNGLL